LEIVSGGARFDEILNDLCASIDLQTSDAYLTILSLERQTSWRSLGQSRKWSRPKHRNINSCSTKVVILAAFSYAILTNAQLSYDAIRYILSKILEDRSEAPIIVCIDDDSAESVAIEGR
jgi:hypothetical protein